MVMLSKIYTRGGDQGETSLGDGSRRSKADLRVEAYGSVDEANAVIGLVRLHTDGDVNHLLSRIQNDLFDLGADLCRPIGEESKNPEKAA
ncbi:MAG: ATP:cob(I)alamin adenosyltransferase, partial [Alphaproteobacteria bacterium]|nr:ATP:cob(I)alamin adenosyltransferase [Alphaproteobacteria bacterium]